MLNLELIEHSMLARGLSNAGLAQACGVSEEAVASWINGESIPRPSKWAALAGVLEVGVQELILKSLPAFPEPVVAFKGQGSLPHTREALEIARDMGAQLRQLLSCMPPVYSARQLVGPSLDAEYVQSVAQGLRAQVGASQDEPLSQAELLALFKESAVILVPVYWEPPHSGELDIEGFGNALSMLLPDSGTVWALINVAGPAADINHGLAHALGHCLTLQALEGSDRDTFAAMLASMLLATSETERSCALSPTTRTAQAPGYAGGALFGEARPSMRDLVLQGEQVLGTPVFRAIAQWQRSEGGRSPAFIAAALNMRLGDAIELSHAVLELK